MDQKNQARRLDFFVVEQTCSIRRPVRVKKLLEFRFYIEDRKAFPVGSTVKSGEIAIELPASVVAKVLLLNTMVQANVRPIDLARKMKVKPQEVTRLTDIRHATKIDTIQKALRALGKELVITLR